MNRDCDSGGDTATKFNGAAVVAQAVFPLIEKRMVLIAAHLGGAAFMELVNLINGPTIKITPVWDSENENWSFTTLEVEDDNDNVEDTIDADDSSQPNNANIQPTEEIKETFNALMSTPDNEQGFKNFAVALINDIAKQTGANKIIAAFELLIFGQTIKQTTEQITTLIGVPTVSATMHRIQNYIFQIIKPFSKELSVVTPAVTAVSEWSPENVDYFSDRIKNFCKKTIIPQLNNTVSVPQIQDILTPQLSDTPPSLPNTLNPPADSNPTSTSNKPADSGDKTNDTKTEKRPGWTNVVRQYLFSPLIVPGVEVALAVLKTGIETDKIVEVDDESGSPDPKDTKEKVYYKVTLSLCFDNTTPKQVLFNESDATNDLSGGGLPLHPNTAFYLPSDPTANIAEQNYPPISTSEFKQIVISPSSFIEKEKHKYDRIYVLHRYNTTIWGRLYGPITKINVRHILIITQLTNGKYYYHEVERNKGKEGELFETHDALVAAFPDISTKITELDRDVQVVEFPDVIYVTTTLRVWNLLPQIKTISRLFYMIWRYYKINTVRIPKNKIWSFKEYTLTVDDTQTIRLTIWKHTRFNDTDNLSRYQNFAKALELIETSGKIRTEKTITFEYEEYIVYENLNMCPPNLYSYDYIIDEDNSFVTTGGVKKFEDWSNTQLESNQVGSE